MDLSTWFLFLRVYGSEVGSFNNFTPVDVFQSYLDSDSNEVNAVRTNEVYFQNKTVILITGNTLLPKLFNETIDYGSYNVSGNWSNGTDYESNYTTGIFNNYDAIHLAAMVATAIILGLIILATVIEHIDSKLLAINVLMDPISNFQEQINDGNDKVRENV
ncbi:hypothetical protein RUM43_013616 [Polyplax serrata]|uniref:Uncharacterized protein n=1 Tax=Polyplax serrata TaxID=468196 RepID=A0AAN8RYZ5_POLSC